MQPASRTGRVLYYEPVHCQATQSPRGPHRKQLTITTTHAGRSAPRWCLATERKPNPRRARSTPNRLGWFVVPDPPLVRRGLGVAGRRVFPVLLAPERTQVEVAPGAP